MFNTSKLLRSAGFTMIELLVVIAVIGVLAVAVLSSINPIEQINKGRDTRSRSDAAQLISAVDRYFAIHEKYPWNEEGVTGIANSFADGWEYSSAGGSTAATSAVPYVTAPAGAGSVTTDYRSLFFFYEADATVDEDEDWSWIIPLMNTAEVKDSFGNRLSKDADNTDFLVKKPEGANRTMYVCFNPSSYAFDLEASNRCDPTKPDTYDQQLTNDVEEACPVAAVTGTVDCFADLTDDEKCMICLP